MDSIRKKKRILEALEEEKEMKKEIREEVVRLLKEAGEEKEEIEIVKELKLQYSKQFFVRFPRDFEGILGLRKGMKIRFIIKINPKGTKEKFDIKLKIVK